MRYDEPGEKFKAWCEGKTGYPFVDAGMRQLIKEGWMHNRVRMVVASFLAKDLHIEWQHGALFFEEHLVDFDVASNAHGWQWTAGCGTDASPYYRVFNPIEQGKRFDENGDYIRKYVPELAHLSADEIHEPWDADGGYKNGYPKKLVEHSVERIESLARLGGDEFGVLLHSNYETSMEIARALLATMSYPFVVGKESIDLGVSIGVASNNSDGDLLRRADVAMYRAKRESLGVAHFDFF